jgi:ribosomal protein L35
MNKIPDSSEILTGYNKFLELRNKQAIANKKYRATENGKLRTIEMHRAWILTKKDDTDYRQNTNLKQRERYHIRRLKKLEDAKKLAESTESTEIIDNDISLGEN